MNTLKKVVLSVIVLLTLCQAANAQFIFRGKVIDSATRQPITSATVNSGNKLTVTDNKGNFRIIVATDTSKILITCIGCQSKLIAYTLSEKPVVISLDKARIDLEEVVISPQLNASSFHTLSTVDLNLRPVNSSQDLMRLVPGLFIAQHMGGGKAEQIFIRGFDADHGTDINVSVDGMPVNMVSHIHGQGYADLHFLIPETVADFDYGKGPYYTGYGDLATGGYLSYRTKDAIDKSMINLEGGQFQTFSGMAMIDLLGAKA
ncbi:MAG TPA: TonB-dependent receptor plug domain-containing protein, partial [Mucilaginibacter sp.]|nr:TonB-dependent receptor plug domain-containing protein [Mucilaginibacter sp.]